MEHTHDYCGDENCLNTDKDWANHEHNYCDDPKACYGDKTQPNHEHDYCDLCEGNQTDRYHECYDYCEYCPDIQTDKNHDCGNYDFFDCCEGIQEESHWCSKMGGEEEIGL